MALELNKLENEVLARWDAEKTFRRSVENRKNAKPFVLYEGPPTANGRPGIHHVITRTFKDIVARFQTMNGRLVERKAGWDEHGLPVEIEVQKALGLNSKKDIEAFGVNKFNKECADSTQKYIVEWIELTRRMGYWLDFQNAYRTSDPKYITKVQEVLGQLLEKGLIYKDYKIVPWACDSGTVVSNAEVAQGYKEVTDTSAYVLFPLCTDDETYLCAWTTTPWTLPANMALAVNPELEYKVCRTFGRRIISLMAPGEVEKTIKGKDLIGQEYYNIYTNKHQTVYGADFVKNEKTGVVHIAPAFGQDDYDLYKSTNMNGGSIVCHVNEDGTFNDQAPDFLKGRRLFQKTFEGSNSLVLKDLEAKELLLDKETYTHQYPHNWRTGLPLIYFLRPSWYVAVNKIREAMIAVNEDVEWFPENVKTGRFGEWLKGDVDWSISRERYWGTPLPFFETDNGPFYHPTAPHKPAADDKVWFTKSVQLHRTPEVLDCWFDSGAMPFAAFDKYQQADCICEAVDQTRGWFYSLMAIGVALTGESPYKTVLCLGHILDKNGQKMSKSKGNVVDPMQLFSKYGADAVRWYMAKNPVGNSMVFNEGDIKTAVNGFLNRLWNCWTFYEMYGTIDGVFDEFVGRVEGPYEEPPKIDTWIESQAKILIKESQDSYENYNIVKVTDLVEKFVDNLSNVWVRANRERFWNTKGQVDRQAYATLEYCLRTVCQVAAPIIPFVTDYIFHKLFVSSVHLTNYPGTGKVTPEDTELAQDMARAQTAIAHGRKARDEQKVKIRQPLRTFYCPETMRTKHFEPLIKDELNVWNVEYKQMEEAWFDFRLDDHLIGEGLARDFIRVCQVLRKDAGLNVTDRIRLVVDFDGNLKLKELLNPFRQPILEKLLATYFVEGKVQGTVKVDKYLIGVEIQKLS